MRRIAEAQPDLPRPPIPRIAAGIVEADQRRRAELVDSHDLRAGRGDSTQAAERQRDSGGSSAPPARGRLFPEGAPTNACPGGTDAIRGALPPPRARPRRVATTDRVSFPGTPATAACPP